MLRWAIAGAGCGGVLGLVPILVVRYGRTPEGPDDGVGPMFLALLPLLLAGILALAVLCGALAGLAIGVMASRGRYIDRSSWEPSRYHERRRGGP